MQRQDEKAEHGTASSGCGTGFTLPESKHKIIDWETGDIIAG